MTDKGNVQVDVAALAKMARLEVSAEELAKLQREIPEILAFVKTIQEVAADAPAKAVPALHNVMRADDNVRESGTYTEDILKEAPDREGNYFKVPQVIKR
jgi:aspartyl-tRNA(Asn)/glutamyl-tRNA(Gln) amidotransferase subunit C